MKTEEFKEILEKYSQNKTLNKEEVALINKYFENKAHKKVLKNMDVKDAKERVYQNIEASINKHDVATKTNLKKSYTKWMVAASVLLVIGLSVFTTINFTVERLTYETNYGEKKEIELPDGTKVILNSGSKIYYPKKFKGNYRKVSLEGEAFFDVYRNPQKPFVIETEKLKTQVLGTSFNIKAFKENDTIKVSVATGKVMVYNTHHVKEILLPNQQIAFNKIDNGYKTTRSNSFVDHAWSHNLIYFNNTNLKEALKIIERWYNVSIEISDPILSQKIITGKYKEQNLKGVLESISFLLNVEFQKISETKYRVTSKN